MSHVCRWKQGVSLMSTTHTEHSLFSTFPWPLVACLPLATPPRTSSTALISDVLFLVVSIMTTFSTVDHPFLSSLAVSQPQLFRVNEQDIRNPHHAPRARTLALGPSHMDVRITTLDLAATERASRAVLMVTPATFATSVLHSVPLWSIPRTSPTHSLPWC